MHEEYNYRIHKFMRNVNKICITTKHGNEHRKRTSNHLGSSERQHSNWHPIKHTNSINFNMNILHHMCVFSFYQFDTRFFIDNKYSCDWMQLIHWIYSFCIHFPIIPISTEIQRYLISWQSKTLSIGSNSNNNTYRTNQSLYSLNISIYFPLIIISISSNNIIQEPQKKQSRQKPNRSNEKQQQKSCRA